VQGPLSRFGDTAANEGCKELLKSYGVSTMLVTFVASVRAYNRSLVATPCPTPARSHTHAHTRSHTRTHAHFISASLWIAWLVGVGVNGVFDTPWASVVGSSIKLSIVLTRPPVGFYQDALIG
jgi:hypothetical protein